MAKTPSLKQQLIQELANQQVAQYRQAQQQNNDIAQLQAQYDAWQKQQEVSALEAQYNDWLKAQQPAQPEAPAVEAPTVEAPIVETAQKPIQKIPSLPKRSLRLEQEEAKMLQKEAQQKQALKEMDNSLRRNRLNDLAQIGLGEGKAEVGSGVKQLSELDKVLEQMKSLPTEEEDIESRIANLDGYGQQTELPRLTDEQKALEQQILNSDKAKVNSTEDDRNILPSFGWGVARLPFNISKILADAALDVGGTVGEMGAGFVDDLTGHHDDKKNTMAVRDAIADKQAQVNENYDWMKEMENQSKENHPMAYGLGNLATQVGAYTVTNPVFDKMGAAIGGGSKAAGFIGNQIGQNVQDLALDTLPRYEEFMADGVLTDEEKQTLAEEARNNAIQNGILGGLSEIPSITKAISDFKPSVASDNMAFFNNAMGKNVLNTGDEVVDAAAKQYAEAAENLENIAKQMPEAPKADIPKMEAPKMPEAEIPEAPKAEAPKTELPKQPEMVDGVRQYIKNENLTPEANTKINSYLQQLDDVFDSPEVADAVSDIFKNVQSEEGSKLMIDYMDLSGELRKTTDPAQVEAIRAQLKELYGNLKSVNPEEKAFIKDMMDMTEVQNAINDYKIALAGSDKDAVKKAAQAIDNARNRIPRRKGADPRLSKAFGGSFGPVIKRPLNEFNFKETDNILDLIDDGVNPNKVMAEDAGIKNLNKPDEVGFNKVEAPKNAEDINLIEGAEDTPIKGDSISETWEGKERGLSKHIRNDGTPMKMEGVADEVAADFEDAPDMYAVLKNSDTVAKAQNVYNSSADPMTEFRDMLKAHDPAALPLGHQLAKDLSAEGKHAAAAQLYREMGEQLTKAGQFSQAAIINMTKNDPLTALNYAERELKALNEQGAKRFGKKWTDLKLTDDEIKAFEGIKPGDEEAIKDLFDKIGIRLGKEYPTTFMDKLLEGRKIAMLFNLRTNVRNFGANVPTLGMRWTADRVEALGQKVAHLINPEFEVTQAVRGSGREGRSLAKKAWETKQVQALVNGTSGKYEIPDLKSTLIQNKQMYKGNAVEKWIDDVTGGGIQKVNEKLFGKKGVQSGLETVRNATYKMLDLGDSPFVKENFVERLGSYIRAQGIKNVDDIPDEAIQMAWEEAMKATYKDNSWAVQMISGLKKDIEKIPVIGRPISQAAIPFVQAPGNIAARMVDYSPIKATKGIADIISGAAKNDVKAVSKGIEEAAKGLTGTGLIVLGMALRKQGIITGSYSEDKDKKAFEKLNGFREYALHIGDKYFTYDWAQPFAEPVMVGTLLADAIEKSDEYDSDLLKYFGVDNKAANVALGVAGEGTKAAINSWFNASPLQGLQEIMSGGYSGKDIASNLRKVAVENFAGAFVPATVNAVAKSIDNTQRNAYDPSSGTASFVNQQIAKIPGLSKTLPAKYDTWGREMKNADNKAMATASRFVIPGDYSYDKNDRIDKEITRLFDATNNVGVFPQVAPSDVSGKKLNNKEVSAFQKDMGQRSRNLAEDFINNKAYDKLEDTEKADVLDKLYKVSKAITERDKFGKEVSNDYKKMVEIYDKAGGGSKGEKALVEEALTKNALNKYDVSDSEGARAILEDHNEKWLQDYGKVKDKLKGSTSSEKIQKAIESTVTSNTKRAEMYSYISPNATPGQNPYGYIPGINYDPKEDKAYQKAKTEIPSLKPEKYYENKDAMDYDSNGSIKQQETVDWMNANGIKENEGMKYWKAYGQDSWKKQPYYRNGKWYLPD